MTAGRTLRVAIVGAGPAGLYTADTLTYNFDVPVEVDLIERLPVPFGLLRYGVAPDHLNIKAAGRTLQDILDRPAVRLFANVEIGRDVSVEDLREHYDAVVYALGASADRRMGIPGEELPGSMSATSFVSWYNGHPEREPSDLMSARAVAVVGVGNVALDVARILVKEPAELEHTDVPHDVIEVLRRSTVTDVHILGRRGARHAKFTTKELRELGQLDNVDVIVDGSLIPESDPEGITPIVRRNLAVLREWVGRAPADRPRRVHFHFGAQPVAVVGEDHVRGVQIARSNEDGVSTGETYELPVQMVMRSVGYRAIPVPGVPFDEVSHIIPTEDHRVLRDGQVSPGEYAVGWVKRGPTGILGTNRSDAHATIAAFRADLEKLSASHDGEPAGIEPLLAERGIGHVDVERWLAILAVENAHGEQYGRQAVKLADWNELLRAAGIETAP